MRGLDGRGSRQLSHGCHRLCVVEVGVEGNRRPVSRQHAKHLDEHAMPFGEVMTGRAHLGEELIERDGPPLGVVRVAGDRALDGAGDLSAVGEGPPEPGWTHSEIRRVVPPRDEPPAGTLEIEGVQYGTRVTIHLHGGDAFARVRGRDDGLWHGARAYQVHYSDGRWWVNDDAPQLVDETSTILEILYQVWRVAGRLLPTAPPPGEHASNRTP
jgi:hypothetical protein